MSRLYSDFANFSFGRLCEEEEQEENTYFYTVLECPVGASQDALKKSYKKLAKVYHPDKIVHETPNMIKRYTQKFQLLQDFDNTKIYVYGQVDINSELIEK